MHRGYDALVERMAEFETKLLEAFYTFEASNRNAVKERAGILEEWAQHPTQ
jgi:hypothetical protein